MSYSNKKLNNAMDKQFEELKEMALNMGIEEEDNHSRALFAVSSCPSIDNPDYGELRTVFAGKACCMINMFKHLFISRPEIRAAVETTLKIMEGIDTLDKIMEQIDLEHKMKNN